MLSQEMRKNGMQEEEKREETKQKKLQTFQISAVTLVCMCIFFSLSQQEGSREGGGDKSAYQNKGLQQFLTTPIVITSIPLPSVLLDVLTRRNDAMHRTV